MTEERVAWECEAAPVLEQLRVRRRAPVAMERKILDRKPDDDEAVSDVVRAIDALGTCRPEGYSGARPIPITVIWDYWRRKGVDDIAADILTHATLRGDRVYLKKMRAKK